MAFIELLFVCLLMSLVRNQNRICDDNKGQIRIKESFRLDTNLVLFTADTAYQLKNFSFGGDRFSYSSIDPISESWTQELRYVFAIDSNEVVILSHENRDGINQLYGYFIELDTNSMSEVSREEFSVNIYTAKRDTYLNLKRLLMKFPDKKLEEHITAISTFPLNIGDLPRRLFFYYLETAPEGTQCSDECQIFKRYIFVESRLPFNDTIERDWIHDKGSERCVPLSSVVDAAVILNDLTPKGSTDKETIFTFDLIEFFDTQYSINKISLTKSVVLNNWTNVRNGTIAELFGCSQQTTAESTAQPNPSPTREGISPESKTQDGSDSTPTQVITHITGDLETVSNVTIDLAPTESQPTKSWALFWALLSLCVFITILLVIALMFYMVWVTPQLERSPSKKPLIEKTSNESVEVSEVSSPTSPRSQISVDNRSKNTDDSQEGLIA